MKKTLIVGLAIACTACAGKMPYLGNDYSGGTYKGTQMQQSAHVTTAKVLKIREVKVQDDPGVIAKSSGAGLGVLGVFGILGTGGNSYGLAAASIVAALVGGAGTTSLSNKLYATTGYEFTVRLEDGRTTAVTQANVDSINVGDTVYLARGNDQVLRLYK
jgi:outer membrane lipoprotein SlyB